MVFFVFLLMGILVYVLITKNNIDVYNNNIKLSKQLLDEALKNRYKYIDEIINLTKKYVVYSESTISKLVSIYNNFDTANDLAKDVFENEYKLFIEKVESINGFEKNIDFLNIHNILSFYDGNVETARKILYENASKYNAIVEKSPTCYIAKVFKYEVVKCEDVAEKKI